MSGGSATAGHLGVEHLAEHPDEHREGEARGPGGEDVGPAAEPLSRPGGPGQGSLEEGMGREIAEAFPPLQLDYRSTD